MPSTVAEGRLASLGTMTYRGIAIGLFVACTLTACLVPEKFVAKVEFHPDASYDYQFDGTASDPLALMELKQRGALSPHTESALKNIGDRMPKERDVRSARYLGNARYDLSIAGHRIPGEDMHLIDILSVVRGNDGVITVSSPELKQKDRQELAKLGIKVDGTLEIKVPSGAQVISQNAQSTPSLFGMIGSYTWKIGTPEQRPLLQFKIKG